MDFEIYGRKVSNFSYIENSSKKSDDEIEFQEFYIVKPVKVNSRVKYPLKVVLHASGFSANLTMIRGVQNISEHEASLADGYTLYVDGSKIRSRDHWWGWHHIEKRSGEFAHKLHPAETRVIDSVTWVKNNLPIDPNRIHLYGVSMGGSGVLGVGLNRGDLFATISVVIPAGVSHGLYRLKNPVWKEPQAPPVFVYLSHLDGHEQHPEELSNKMISEKKFLSFVWGPQGHDPTLAALEVSALAEFQMSIVKNHAYPAFFNVTQNSEYPGYNETKKGSQFGFINSQFRWKIVEDSDKKFVAQIWLALMPAKYSPAEKQIADIEFKRAQTFNFGPSECKILKDGKIVKSVSLKSPSECLEKVEISKNPVEIQFLKN